MAEFGHDLMRALLMAAGMFWEVGWSLVLGFVISAMLQALVSRDRIVAALGQGGPREVALATIAGAASSSCSYAAAAVTRTLFAKGAALGPSLAFLFASTNLVVELGAALLLLMGWQFTLAEWVGGVVLVAILSVLVRLTASPRLIAEARAQAGGGRDLANTAGRAARWRSGCGSATPGSRSRRILQATGGCCGATCCWDS